jgi:hypothetical protein
MRLPGFVCVRSMNKLIGLCLCLVLICLATAGAVVYTQRSYGGGMLPGIQVCQAEPLQQNGVDYAPSAIGGSKPDIQVWKANPMVLDTASAFAIYTFKVKNATGLIINEAGANIKSVNNPSGATLQGTANGNPASSIPADANGQFTCTITASNGDGSVQAELTLSLAKNLLPQGPPPGTTGNQIKNKSRWLEQTGSQAPLTQSTPPTNPTHPDFFKCPDSCKYCLEPGDAAKLGFTQKCSDQRCFYDPENKRSWYCYSEPEGWCCANEKVSQATKSECTQIGGYWSTSQADAQQFCQPKGFCCLNGNVYYPTTQAQCAQQGGTYWSTNQAQVTERCQPQMCWCCTPYRGTPTFAAGGGSVSQMTQAQCQQQGGTCYATQAQATAACGQSPPQPQTCWCCSNGQLYQTYQSQCAGTCYSSYEQGLQYCRQAPLTPNIK